MLQDQTVSPDVAHAHYVNTVLQRLGKEGGPDNIENRLYFLGHPAGLALVVPRWIHKEATAKFEPFYPSLEHRSHRKSASYAYEACAKLTFVCGQEAVTTPLETLRRQREALKSDVEAAFEVRLSDDQALLVKELSEIRDGVAKDLTWLRTSQESYEQSEGSERVVSVIELQRVQLMEKVERLVEFFDSTFKVWAKEAAVSCYRSSQNFMTKREGDVDYEAEMVAKWAELQNELVDTVNQGRVAETRSHGEIGL